MRVRTTVTIEEGLLKQAKRLALEQDSSLSEVIERSLRQGLLGIRIADCDLPSVSLGAPLPGVDLTGNSALDELVEGWR